MRLKFTTIAIAALLAEILGVFALVLLVAAFGSGNEAETRELAGRLGFYTGPVSGFLLCTAGGYWAARRAGTSFLANGVAVGVGAAILDAVIALALGASFQWIFLISNAGRIIAGALGGSLAQKRHG